MPSDRYFGELLTLEDQLEASRYLAKPEQLWSDDDAERVHVALELMFLEDAE